MPGVVKPYQGLLLTIIVGVKNACTESNKECRECWEVSFFDYLYFIFSGLKDVSKPLYHIFDIFFCFGEILESLPTWHLSSTTVHLVAYNNEMSLVGSEDPVRLLHLSYRLGSFQIPLQLFLLDRLYWCHLSRVQSFFYFNE